VYYYIYIYIIIYIYIYYSVLFGIGPTWFSVFFCKFKVIFLIIIYVYIYNSIYIYIYITVSCLALGRRGSLHFFVNPKSFFP